ncbi:hypothetical protein NT6N_19720 [Oceaniferula spumae]|uniref:F5/8 type C domain-containing protein n=1 Tax=Oceaniferula spumae TaxID=2979115 RepID=A0AAT9FLY6_9BACT
MKTQINFFLGAALISTASAAVVTDTVVQNRRLNWSHMPGATASQSSTGSGGAASRAIDNNYSGAWADGSVTHTAGTTAIGDFWQVDLGAVRSIDDITLFNRTDCCDGRLSGYSVLASNVSDFSTTVFDSGVQTDTAGTSINFAAGVSAQYVRVRRDATSNHGDNVISLAEVDVLGGPSEFTFTNLALGSTASQSSTLANGNIPSADKAIDGILANSFNHSSTTHTNPNAGGAVFWETTFSSLADINEIALYNRADCCPTRLSNFRVSIFDGATEVWGENYFEGTGNADLIFSIQEDTGAYIGTGDRVRIELIGGLNNDGNNVLSLREVEIYGVLVPEPSSTALLGLAGLALLFHRRK